MRQPPTQLFGGGFTFAEHPDVEAPDARIIWRADFDPGTLEVVVSPVTRRGPDDVALAAIEPWLTISVDSASREHAVLSDGWHHIRLDVADGHLAGHDVVQFAYRLSGLTSTESRLLPLKRLIHLCRHRRFARSLYPPDPRIARWLLLLRVHDALSAGASQREIGIGLFGEARVDAQWNGRTDALRSRVRRLVRDATSMARGGYRSLLGGRLSR